MKSLSGLGLLDRKRRSERKVIGEEGDGGRPDGGGVADDRLFAFGVNVGKGSPSRLSRLFQQPVIIGFLPYTENSSAQWQWAGGGDSFVGHWPYSQRVHKPVGKKGQHTNDPPPGPLCPARGCRRRRGRGSGSTDGGRRVSALAGARYWGKGWSRKARNREEQGFGAKSGSEPQPSLGTV